MQPIVVHGLGCNEDGLEHIEPVQMMLRDTRTGNRVLKLDWCGELAYFAGSSEEVVQCANKWRKILL